MARPRRFFPAAIAASLLLPAALARSESLDAPFRMTVLDVFKITGRGVVLTGQVGSGAASVGDWVCVPMQGGAAVGRQITGLEMFRKVLERVEAGENVGVMVGDLDHRQIERNADLVAGCETATER